MFISVLFFIPFVSKASEPAAKYTLNYEEIKQDINEDILIHHPLTSIQPGEIKFLTKPAFVSSKPMYFVLSIPGVKTSINMVLDEQSGTGTGYDVLYIDLNGDKNISENEKIRMNSKEQFFCAEIKQFTSADVTAVVELQNGTKVPYFFCVSYSSVSLEDNIDNSSFTAVDKGWYTGNIEIDGSKVKTAVIFDLSEYSRSKKISDSVKKIFADTDKNGIFETNMRLLNEIYEADKDIMMAKNIFTLDCSGISGDFQSLTLSLTKKDIEFGALNVPSHQDFVIVLKKEQGESILKVIGKNDKCDVPAGKYLLQECVTLKKDNKDVLWELSVYGFADNNNITIESEEALKKKKGDKKETDKDISLSANKIENITPVEAKVKVKVTKDKKKNNVSFDFTLNVPAKAKTVLVKNNIPYAPKFSVLDKDGKIIYSGQFQYG